MFKKIRKLLQEDLTQRYQAFEERYLRFENKLYKTMEERLANLEQRFDDLAAVLSGNKQQPPQRQKQEKQSAPPAENEPNAAPSEQKADLTDLQQLKGLGKTLEEKLKGAGIESLTQLAALSDEQVKEIDAKIPGFEVRCNRYDWRKQAKDLL